MIGKALLIGDPHAHPDYPNDRFSWLGNFIMEEKPDMIYCAGDLFDLPSLCGYDKGTKGFEGRRFKKDIEAGLDAQDKLFSPVTAWNKRQSKNRKAQYKPRTIFTVGNHSERIDRAIQKQAELDGTIGMKDCQLEKYWDTIIPFKETGVVEGFALSHYFTAGVMGRPIGGECPADACLKKLGMSNISGHSHLLDVKVRTKADGSKTMGIVAGCYVHPEMIKKKKKNTASLWWNGVILLHEMENGYAQGVECLTQDRIKRLYA